MLMDASLALKERIAPVGNDLCFTGKRLVVITGANQGGKTTFLRGAGIAQVMAQCGMFVAAKAYESPLFNGIYTFFPSGEDPGIKMGLLEMELNKLSCIIDKIKPGSLLFMNESFQTTMPLDAKHLADGIVAALNDAEVTVCFVTHLYAYADGLYRRHREDMLFLRAGRDSNDKNTFILREGAPYKSAYGMELFCEIVNINQRDC
jgi:DNA mismatch repair ATPase MutS